MLKPLPNYNPPTYKLGGTAEVTWAIRNNHVSVLARCSMSGGGGGGGGGPLGVWSHAIDCACSCPSYGSSTAPLFSLLLLLLLFFRLVQGGGYSYRLCPLPEGNFTDLTEACFQENPLDFVQDEQSIVFPNGTLQKLSASQSTFVTEGTSPAGSMWSLMPMPPTALGPCCLPGTYDDNGTEHRCLPGDSSVGGASSNTCHNGACSECPGTPGSDCSRCDQVDRVMPGRYTTGPPFPPPCEGCEGVDWSGFSVRVSEMVLSANSATDSL